MLQRLAKGHAFDDFIASSWFTDKFVVEVAVIVRNDFKFVALIFVLDDSDFGIEIHGRRKRRC
jgi:hypothetical protein